MFKAWHISVPVNRRVADVYRFASNPKNLPQWAGGLVQSIKKKDGVWVGESALGTIEIEFTEKNSFGILDHLVILPSGEKVYNPMRVVQNDTGSEVIFTLYRREGVTDEQFADDTKAVMKDMKRLKDVLEAGK